MRPLVEPTQRLVVRGDRAIWARALSALFVELHVQIHRQNDNSRLIADKHSFGDLELVRTQVYDAEFSVLRSEDLVARSTSNYFFIACIIDGGITLAQASRSIAMVTSDLAVLDSTEPYRIDVGGKLDVLWIRVPRHRIEGRISRSAEVLAQRIDGSRGTGHLASTLVHASLREAERLSASEALRTSNALLDLVCLSLDVTVRPADRRPKQLLRRIQNHIDANLADPGLCRASIAESTGLSVRYLNRIFEREGLSVARWIRLRRLEMSRQRIEAPAGENATISEIALACGFNNVSSFNRAFKNHFGTTPSSLRQIVGSSSARASKDAPLGSLRGAP